MAPSAYAETGEKTNGQPEQAADAASIETPAATDDAPADVATEAAPAAEFGAELAKTLRRAYDTNRSWDDLVAQVDIGPRHPGSPGAAVFVEWAEARFAEAGITATRQIFAATDPLSGQLLDGTNVIARWRPDAPRTIILSAHWDSRRWADRDPIRSNRRLPVPAANDGGSGVAVLLEVARVLNAHADAIPADLGVEFVLFDFEDQGHATTSETFCYGSLHYAESFVRRSEIVAAINIDMIGDDDLLIEVERYSRDHAIELVRDVWSHGRSLHPLNFSDTVTIPIFDDHIRLQRIGIPAINLIDFDYPEWHTIDDAPYSCSPESLRVVGTTLLSYIGYGAARKTP